MTSFCFHHNKTSYTLLCENKEKNKQNKTKQKKRQRKKERKKEKKKNEIRIISLFRNSLSSAKKGSPYGAGCFFKNVSQECRHQSSFRCSSVLRHSQEEGRRNKKEDRGKEVKKRERRRETKIRKLLFVVLFMIVGFLSF